MINLKKTPARSCGNTRAPTPPSLPCLQATCYHTALWKALHVIMHPALILSGTINLDKSSHDFFHSHCHSPTPMIIMAHPLTSSNDTSLSTSIHYIENYPVHPKPFHSQPLISTF